MTLRTAGTAAVWAVVPSLLTLLALVAAAPAPVSADDSAADSQQLRQRVLELRRDLVMRDLEIDRLAQELAELRSQVESCTTGARRPSSGMPEVIDDEVEITGLGRIEEFELEEPAASPSSPVVEPPATATAASASGPEPAPSAPGSGGEELYDQGYALFHQQQYPEAERAFRLFLSRFPASDLADNALFWIGESRWARGDFAAALESYTATVEQYPDGNKVPDALLKAGRCLETLGQIGRAVRTYEEVALRFAGSAAAITAQERLDELR